MNKKHTLKYKIKERLKEFLYSKGVSWSVLYCIWFIWHFTWEKIRYDVRKFSFGFLTGLIAVFIYSLSISRYGDLLQLDIFSYINKNRPFSKKIVLVGIDNKTLKDFGLSSKMAPSRSSLAEVLNKIHNYKPKVIFLDLMILKEKKEGDTELIKALKKGKTTVGYGVETLKKINGVKEIKIESANRFKKAAFKTIELVGRPYYSINCLMSAYSDPSLPASNRIPLLSLIEEVFNIKINDPPSVYDFINFYKTSSIPYMSFSDVLKIKDDKKLKKFFKDKMVFLGFTTSLNGERVHSKELFDVPGFGKKVFGIEIKAQRASNLLENDWIKRFSDLDESFFIFYFVFFTTIFALHKKKKDLIIFLIQVSFLWILLAFYAFFFFNTFIPGAGIVIPLFIFLLIGILAFQNTGYKHKIKIFEKLFGVNVFKRFWSDELKLFRIGLSFLGLVLLFLLWISPIEKIITRETINYLFQTKKDKNLPKNIVIVSIDDDSIKNLGLSFKSPVDSKIIAKALNLIKLYNPKLIISNLYLHREDKNYSTKEFISALKSTFVIFNPSLISGKFLYPYKKEGVLFIPFNFIKEDKNHIRLTSKNTFKLNKESLKIPLEIQFPFLRALESIKKISNLDNRFLINYSTSIKRISLYELFNSNKIFLKNFFKDKIILLGYETIMHRRALSKTQQRKVPGFERKMFETEIFANIVENLLNSTYIKRLEYITEFIIISLFFGLITIPAILLPSFWPIGVILSGIFIWLIVVKFLFNYFLIYLPGLLESIIILSLLSIIVFFVDSILYAKKTKELEEALNNLIKLETLG